MKDEQLMNRAVAAHQASRLQEAVDAYAQVLQQEPAHAHALHLRGVALSQLGRHDEAIASIEQALRLSPSQAEWLQNLGKACLENGDAPRAEKHLRAALELNPNLAEAHFNLGNVYKKLEREQDAIACYERVVRLTPKHARAWNNLGNSLQKIEKLDLAQTALRNAVGLAPNYAEAWLNLGMVLNEARRSEEALDCQMRALRIKPELTESHLNRGVALLDIGRIDEAMEAFEEALRQKPDLAEAHNNQGNVWTARNRLDLAQACYERAVQLKPDDHNHHFNLGMLYLTLGDYARGWPEYEWGLKRKTRQPIREFKQPRWQGERFDGKTLLVYAEQGVGDTFQFLRYLSKVKALGGRVLVETQIGLRSLVQRCAGVDQVVERQKSGEVAAPFDVYVAMMSLPAIFGDATDADIPAATPYICADPVRVEHWRGRLAPDSLRKIGIVWAGNPEHRNDRNRSCDLSLFAPLAALPGVALYSLQVGAQAAQLKTAGFSITDLAPELKSYEETAAAITQLDLVISVDTSVAHLAAALGKPVWLLLPFAPDWRWQLRREDTPWYPQMRLFRQRLPGDWIGTIEHVSAALRQSA